MIISFKVSWEQNYSLTKQNFAFTGLLLRLTWNRLITHRLIKIEGIKCFLAGKCSLYFDLDVQHSGQTCI